MKILLTVFIYCLSVLAGELKTEKLEIGLNMGSWDNEPVIYVAGNYMFMIGYKNGPNELEVFKRIEKIRGQLLRYGMGLSENVRDAYKASRTARYSCNVTYEKSVIEGEEYYVLSQIESCEVVQLSPLNRKVAVPVAHYIEPVLFFESVQKNKEKSSGAAPM